MGSSIFFATNWWGNSIRAKETEQTDEEGWLCAGAALELIVQRIQHCTSSTEHSVETVACVQEQASSAQHRMIQAVIPATATHTQPL